MHSDAIEISALFSAAVVMVIYGVWRINHSAIELETTNQRVTLPDNAGLIMRLGATFGYIISKSHHMSKFKPNGNVDDILIQAGSPFGLNGAEYHLVSVGAVALGIGIGAIVAFLLHLNIIIALMIGAIVAAYPRLKVRSARKERVFKIERSLPHTTELIVMAMESGAQLRQALSEVVRRTDGPLTDEMSRALNTMNTGVGESEALATMAKRINMSNVDHLVTALIGTKHSGVGTYLDHLKLQVERLQRERLEASEKSARSLMVRLAIPLVVFFLPSMGLVLLGPGMVQIMHGLG